MPPSKQALIDQMVGAVEDPHDVLLVGEPGVGKTCTLRALRTRLPDAGFRLTYCHNATLGRRDFYRQLCLVSTPVGKRGNLRANPRGRERSRRRSGSDTFGMHP